MNSSPASHAVRAARGTPPALAMAVCLLTAGCSALGGTDSDSDSGDDSTGGANTSRIKVASATHGAVGAACRELVRMGAQTAAAQDDVEPMYVKDADATEQAKLGRDTVAQVAKLAESGTP